MKQHMRHYGRLCIWIVALLGIGAGIGYLTQDSINTWYPTLHRSPLTPPDITFSIVWSILYTMIAIAGWTIWQHHKKNMTRIKQLFVLQLLLNWSWSPLFFHFHLIGSSLLCIILIWLTLLALLTQSFSRIRSVFWLLLPYFLWVSFAAYLNAYIWWPH